MLSLQRLESLRDRRVRDQDKLFLAEGFRFLVSAVANRSEIVELALCPALYPTDQCRRIVAQIEVEKRNLSKKEFLSLSIAQEPQGVIVIARQKWHPLIETSANSNSVHLVLDQPRSPGNLGAILRTCEAFGICSVWLIGGEADPYDPVSIRASMGAIFSQRLVRTSFRAIEGWKKRHPCLFVATSPYDGRDISDSDLRGPVAIVMGNERTGIRPRQTALCEQFVRIPMIGPTDSLNLAVATSIALFEAFKQNRGVPSVAAAWYPP